MFFQCVGGKASIHNFMVDQQKPGISVFFPWCLEKMVPDGHACIFIANKGVMKYTTTGTARTNRKKKNMDCVVCFVFATVGQLGVFHRTLHNVSIIGIICELKCKNILSGITYYPAM